MAEISLTARTPLEGLDVTDGNCRMREVTDCGLMSVATPLGGEASLKKALKRVFGFELPDPTVSIVAGDVRAVRTNPDQVLLLLAGNPDALAHTVSAQIDAQGYITRQTDSWVMCAVSGTDARLALERLCPIDLHDSAFSVDAAARTVMEHMSAIIIRTGTDDYLLMSASSSAKSFAHAITQSMRYVAPD